jgi:hypothetical protein
VQKGRTPFEKYFIMHHVWDEFIEKMTTEEAKDKGEKFSDLVKKNELKHHLGMTGFASKRNR